MRFLLVLGHLTAFSLAVIVMACAKPDLSGAQEAPPPHLGKDAKVTPVQPTPQLWETRARGMYENRGVAVIEKLGTRHVLTIYCDGVHRVYLHNTQRVHVEKYQSKFVRVGYTYVDVTHAAVKCIKPPCGPFTERRILVQDIEKVSVSEEARARFESTCPP